MKSLILIYSNPTSRQMWEQFSPAEQAEGFKYYNALTENLVASGELVLSEALADVSTTKRVHVRDGQTLTTDGPFAESKEHLMPDTNELLRELARARLAYSSGASETSPHARMRCRRPCSQRRPNGPASACPRIRRAGS